VADLVPGDLIQLCAGDLIPADGRVLEAKDFFVNRAGQQSSAKSPPRSPIDVRPPPLNWASNILACSSCV
jgi:Mg2+-importing ATPase